MVRRRELKGLKTISQILHMIIAFTSQLLQHVLKLRLVSLKQMTVEKMSVHSRPPAAVSDESALQPLLLAADRQPAMSYQHSL